MLNMILLQYSVIVLILQPLEVLLIGSNFKMKFGNT